MQRRPLDARPDDEGRKWTLDADALLGVTTEKVDDMVNYVKKYDL